MALFKISKASQSTKNDFLFTIYGHTFTFIPFDIYLFFSLTHSLSLGFSFVAKYYNFTTNSNASIILPTEKGTNKIN